MTLGERIKELRNKSNLSQEKLVLELNVSRQIVQKWETDVSQPSLTTLNAIARLFNVNLDYLVNGKEILNKENITTLENIQNKMVPEERTEC